MVGASNLSGENVSSLFSKEFALCTTQLSNYVEGKKVQLDKEAATGK